MRKQLNIICMILLTVLCVSSSWAINEEVKTSINDLYQKIDRAFENKDVEGIMETMSDDFLMVFYGFDKKFLRQKIENILKDAAEIKSEITIEKIEKHDSFFAVYLHTKVERKKVDSDEWESMFDDSSIDYLKRDGESFKIHASVNIQKDRLKNIKDHTYTNSVIGYSMSVPETWSILPITIPQMSDGVAFISPSISSFGAFGIVELPSNIGAKEAVEGDDAATKKLSDDDYQKFQDGSYKMGELEGYESLSQFKFKMGSLETPERKRRRVYFKSGSMLYVFFFDAIPPKKWETYQGDFDAILKSFTLDPDAKTDAAGKLRKLKAQGEVMGRIYTNQNLGCQIAGPDGWTIKPSTLGDAFHFNVEMTPPEGDSKIRFIALSTGTKVSLEEITKHDVEAIKAVTEEFEAEPAEDITVGNIKGKVVVFQFSLKGLGTLKRKCAYFLNDKTLYFVVCDANPPSDYTKYIDEFDQTIQSFTLN